MDTVLSNTNKFLHLFFMLNFYFLSVHLGDLIFIGILSLFIY